MKRNDKLCRAMNCKSASSTSMGRWDLPICTVNADRTRDGNTYKTVFKRGVPECCPYMLEQIASAYMKEQEICLK